MHTEPQPDTFGNADAAPTDFPTIEAANDAVADPVSASIVNIDGTPFVPQEEYLAPEINVSAYETDAPQAQVNTKVDIELPLGESKVDAQEDDVFARFNISGLSLVPKDGEVVPRPTETETATATTREVAVEKKSTKEVALDVLAKFSERLGIDPEGLKNFEGFAELSKGQQKMVLENLTALVVGRIQEEAKDGAEEASKLAKKDAGFMKKIWLGFAESFGAKRIDQGKREKTLAVEMEKGGLAVHGEMLAKLVGGMKEYGPEVDEDKEGNLRVKYLGTEGLTPEVAERVEAFNAQADSFSKVPYEWSLSTATSEQQKMYATEKLAFDMKKKETLGLLAGAGESAGAMAVMADIEGKIAVSRFMHTTPDAVEEFKNIKDQNVWTRAAKSTIAERGTYMALGGVARTVLAYPLGMFAAPVAGGLVGGMREYFKAKESLREQDLAMRQGKGVEASQAGEKTSKNMVEAGGEKGSIAKINLLVSRIDVIDQQLMSGPPADEAEKLHKKKAQLTAFLSERLDYTQEKVSEGKMIFGKAEDRLSNQYELMSVLSRGRAEVSAGENELAVVGVEYGRADVLSARIASTLEKADASTVSARKSMIVAKTRKGAIMGAGFGMLGALAVDAHKWMQGSQASFFGEQLGDFDEVKAEALERLASARAGVEELIPENVMQALSSVGESVSSSVDAIRRMMDGWVGTPSHPGLDAEGTTVAHPGLDAEGTTIAHPGLDAEGTTATRPVPPRPTISVPRPTAPQPPARVTLDSFLENRTPTQYADAQPQAQPNFLAGVRPAEIVPPPVEQVAPGGRPVIEENIIQRPVVRPAPSSFSVQTGNQFGGTTPPAEYGVDVSPDGTPEVVEQTIQRPQAPRPASPTAGNQFGGGPVPAEHSVDYTTGKKIVFEKDEIIQRPVVRVTSTPGAAGGQFGAGPVPAEYGVGSATGEDLPDTVRVEVGAGEAQEQVRPGGKPMARKPGIRIDDRGRVHTGNTDIDQRLRNDRAMRQYRDSVARANTIRAGGNVPRVRTSTGESAGNAALRALLDRMGRR